MAEEEPCSLISIARSQKIPAKEFEKQYKNYLSNFHTWDQKEHAEEWLLFPENIGEKLSIDEVAISNGELYTIITNKAAHGKKKALVAIVAGTRMQDVCWVLDKISLKQRNTVKEVTLDLSNAMEAIVKKSFPESVIVDDRFHVQQLISEAVQEIRIMQRREALKEENEAIKICRAEKKKYEPIIFKNGDTKKQLLARSHHLLFKPESKWTVGQKERANILFEEFPEVKKAYELSMMFRSCYENSHSILEAKERFQKWYEKVEEKQIEGFLVVADSIRLHEATILNYFINRSTNASAESFNAKLKGFRALVRGVTDKKFFLFRVAKLYA
ncbi:MAG: transposase [Candidatus Falkowbacteria bacterium]|nr:transposase [Candidatus Falkowbacteria bacterium]